MFSLTCYCLPNYKIWMGKWTEDITIVKCVNVTFVNQKDKKGALYQLRKHSPPICTCLTMIMSHMCSNKLCGFNQTELNAPVF